MLTPFTALGQLAKKVSPTYRFKKPSELTLEDIKLSMEIQRAKKLDAKRVKSKRYV